MIRLESVKKIYRTEFYEVFALNGVTMEIDEGEFVAIMGPSGSGKSTLLNMIGCLDKPSEGEVYIDGIVTSNLSERELTELRRDKIGFIFQQYNLIPNLTVKENVELPMVFRGLSKNKREKKVAKLLDLVGIAELAVRKPKELSGGQQQRVAIARALANNPAILLCDEPTGNIDTKSGKGVMDVIKELNRGGVTVVLVTHDPSIAGYAERIIKIRDGAVDVS